MNGECRSGHCEECRNTGREMMSVTEKWVKNKDLTVKGARPARVLYANTVWTCGGSLALTVFDGQTIVWCGTSTVEVHCHLGHDASTTKLPILDVLPLSSLRLPSACKLRSHRFTDSIP